MMYEDNEGIQCMRELIYYNNMNVTKYCMSKDKNSMGSISYQHFMDVFVTSSIGLSKKYQDDIWRDGPKTNSNELKYKLLFDTLASQGPPSSIYSIEMMKTNDAMSIIDIIRPKQSIYHMMKQSELVNFGLHRADISSMIHNTSDIDISFTRHNTEAYLHNYLVYVCRQILRVSLESASPDVSDSVKTEYIARTLCVSGTDMYKNISMYSECDV